MTERNNRMRNNHFLEVEIYKKLKSFDLDVKFTLGKECIGLTGRSGSGKSMTLKCIAGIETPDRGRIVYQGKVLFDSEKKINLSAQKRNIGYLFQSYALFDNMNVYQNIACGLKAHHVVEKEKRIQEMLDLFHINELRERYPRQLSGGEKQRVALARIFAYPPEVLLLDEPFSAIDEELKEGLKIELIQMIKRYQIPVIFVSHNKEEVNQFCQKKLIIRSGGFE